MDAAGERDPVGGGGMIRPYITDHAVVRFCQRVQGRAEETTGELTAAGVDVDQIRQSIVAIVHAGVQAGCSGVTWGGFRFMLGGSAVKTVLTREQFYNRPAYLALKDHAGARP